jgi:hypothetical protein
VAEIVTAGPNRTAVARTSEHDRRVIVGDIEHRRVQRQDFKVVTGINNVDVAIRSQVSVVPSLTAHPLHSVHDLEALSKNSVS